LHREPPTGRQRDAWIAGRIKTLLSHYFTPEISPELEDAAMDDWIDILSACHPEDIDHACKSYLRSQPRKRPTPGDIRGRAMENAKGRIEAHRRSLPSPPPEPQKPRVSAEVAERIMQEAGFNRQLSDVLKRFPKSQTREAAMQRSEEISTEKHWIHSADEKQLEQLRQARIAAGVLPEGQV
jgi:hypothetical protein